MIHRHQCGCFEFARFARFARFAHFARFEFCTFRIPVCIPAYLPIAHARDNRSAAWLHPVDDAGKSRGLPDAFSIEFYEKLTIGRKRPISSSPVAVLCFLQS